MKIIVFFKINSNCNGNHQSQLYPTIILSMKQMSIKCMKIHKMIQNKTNYKLFLCRFFLLFWCFVVVVLNGLNGTNGKNKSNKIFDCVCMYIFRNIYLSAVFEKNVIRMTKFSIVLRQKPKSLYIIKSSGEV